MTPCISTSNMESLTSFSNPQPKLNDPPRRGTWTNEEEEYVAALIDEFKLGYLPLKEGMSLRCFLSKMLRCNPKRISKKFEGSNYNGKQLFEQTHQGLDEEEAKLRKQKLQELEDKFEKSVLALKSMEMRRSVCALTAKTIGKSAVGSSLGPQSGMIGGPRGPRMFQPEANQLRISLATSMPQSMNPIGMVMAPGMAMANGMGMVPNMMGGAAMGVVPGMCGAPMNMAPNMGMAMGSAFAMSAVPGMGFGMNAFPSLPGVVTPALGLGRVDASEQRRSIAQAKRGSKMSECGSKASTAIDLCDDTKLPDEDSEESDMKTSSNCQTLPDLCDVSESESSSRSYSTRSSNMNEAQERRSSLSQEQRSQKRHEQRTYRRMMDLLSRPTSGQQSKRPSLHAQGSEDSKRRRRM